MVRLPREARESLHTLDRLKIRTPRGANAPLATVAEVAFTKAPSYVERNDGAEIIRCGCQPVDETVDILGIAREITPRLTEMCSRENLSFQFKGYVAEAEEAQRRTMLGAMVLSLALYGLLAIALKSLIQPFFVRLAVPFAIIGELLGHIFLDMTPLYLSVFGVLAFGVLFATGITLYLIPCALMIAEDLRKALAWCREWYFRPFRTADTEKP